MTLENTGTISSLLLSLSPSLPPFNRSSLDACCVPGIMVSTGESALNKVDMGCRWVFSLAWSYRDYLGQLLSHFP